MIGCGMARTDQLLFRDAVTRAPGSVRTFPNQPLTISRSGCAVMRSGAMRMCTRLCTVDATTMRVRIVSGQVVPPFAEGAMLP